MSKEKTRQQLIEENQKLWEANNALGGADLKANARIQDMRKVMEENEQKARKDLTRILRGPVPRGMDENGYLYNFGAGELSWAEIFAEIGRLQTRNTQLARYENIDSTIGKVNMLMQDFEARKKHRHDSCN